MKPGDRLVCALVEPLPLGASFKDWPLHITIVPWFRTDVPSDSLASEMSAALKDIDPFEVVMDGTAKFGRGKTVNLAQLPTPLTEVETRVRQILKLHQAWLVDETTKHQRPFRPHVTAQKSVRLQEGDNWRCDRLYIIEQKGDHKEVRALAALNR
jgi:2'-5' RNA ligase